MDPVILLHWVDCPVCRPELERAQETQPRKLNSVSVCGHCNNPGVSCNQNVGYSQQLGNDAPDQSQERSTCNTSRKETSKSAAPTVLNPAESLTRMRIRFPFLFLDGENHENIPNIDSWMDYLREDSLSPLPYPELDISDSTNVKELEDHKKYEFIFPASVYTDCSEEFDSSSSKFQVPFQPQAEALNPSYEQSPKTRMEFKLKLDSELALEVHLDKHGVSTTQANFKVPQPQNQRPKLSSRYIENGDELFWNPVQRTDKSPGCAEPKRIDVSLESLQTTGQSQNSWTVFEMFTEFRKETDLLPGTRGVFKLPTEQKRKEKYPNQSTDSNLLNRDIDEISTHPKQQTDSSKKPEHVFKVPLPPSPRVKKLSGYTDVQRSDIESNTPTSSNPTEPSPESWHIFDISNEPPKQTETGAKPGEELMRNIQNEQDKQRGGQSPQRVQQGKPDHQNKQTNNGDLREAHSDGSNAQKAKSDFHYVGLTHSPQGNAITSTFLGANGHYTTVASSKNEGTLGQSESGQQGLHVSFPLDNDDSLLVQARKSSRKRSCQNDDVLEPSQRDCTVTRRTSMIFFPPQTTTYPSSNEDISQPDSYVGQKENEADRSKSLEREKPNNPTLSIAYSGEGVPSHSPCLANSGRLHSMLNGRNHVGLRNDHQGAQVSSSIPALSGKRMREPLLPATSFKSETGKSPQRRSTTLKNRAK